MNETIKLRLKLRNRLVMSEYTFQSTNRFTVDTPNQRHGGRHHALKAVDKHTKGRLYLSTTKAVFEDEQDAIMFALGYEA